MSEITWMDMVDDPQADVYETLRIMHKERPPSRIILSVPAWPWRTPASALRPN